MAMPSSTAPSNHHFACVIASSISPRPLSATTFALLKRSKSGATTNSEG